MNLVIKHLGLLLKEQPYGTYKFVLYSYIFESVKFMWKNYFKKFFSSVNVTIVIKFSIFKAAKLFFNKGFF